MEDPRPRELTPESNELIERGDLDELTSHVNALVLDHRWAELDVLRDRCRLAVHRGKQLWAVASHIEYRLCLEAPGPWAALMLESGSGRFAMGPLPEVAASTHTWAELSPHLHGTPEAAMVAQERALRGEDLTGDQFAAHLPEILDLPLRLQPWEPSYALAEYHPDRMEAPSPPTPPLAPVPAALAGPNGAPSHPAPGGAGTDEVTAALEELASTWTTESNGRAVAATTSGAALDAVAALGTHATELVELAPADAVATMAWAAGNGGAYGRRRGAAPGRFGAWWVLAAVGGLTDQSPLRADEVGGVADAVRWYSWGSGEPATGWVLRLAFDVARGPHGARAWAVAATDAA
jgi:hypothetical protein